jgi:hypothetical protein
MLATALILTLPGGLVPVGAAEPLATLTGSIVRATDDAPIPGARLHAGDPRTGRDFSTIPAGHDGSFALGDLPPSTYRLAVEADDGLYVVKTPIVMAPGMADTVHVSVHRFVERERDRDDDDSDDEFTFWDNPLTAALSFLGLAAVAGAVIGGKSEGSGTPSPTAP